MLLRPKSTKNAAYGWFPFASFLPKCPTTTPLTTPVAGFVVLHTLIWSLCPTLTRERTYSQWGECGTLWRKWEGPMPDSSVADKAGAVGLEQGAQVLHAGHQAAALVGVANQDLLF